MCPSRPGLYELVGNGEDATLVAAIIAQRIGGACLWIRSPETRDPRSFEKIFNWSPSVCLEAEIVGAAFQAVRDLSPVYDMIVLDSLAGLRGDHPGARNVAQYVTRAIRGLRPTIPVLVTNQHREPAPPGGMWWRETVVSRSLLFVRHNAPPFMSWLMGTNQWMVWYADSVPELRCLSPSERKLVQGREGGALGRLPMAEWDIKNRDLPWIVDLCEL